MPCHGIFLFFFSTWKLFGDMAKHSMACQRICMVGFGINNGLLILNMGLAKKVVKSNTV
jgi:hypothetical protein